MFFRRRRLIPRSGWFSPATGAARLFSAATDRSVSWNTKHTVEDLIRESETEHKKVRRFIYRVKRETKRLERGWRRVRINERVPECRLQSFLSVRSTTSTPPSPPSMLPFCPAAAAASPPAPHKHLSMFTAQWSTSWGSDGPDTHSTIIHADVIMHGTKRSGRYLVWRCVTPCLQDSCYSNVKQQQYSWVDVNWPIVVSVEVEVIRWGAVSRYDDVLQTKESPEKTKHQRFKCTSAALRTILL